MYIYRLVLLLVVGIYLFSPPSWIGGSTPRAPGIALICYG